MVERPNPVEVADSILNIINKVENEYDLPGKEQWTRSLICERILYALQAAEDYGAENERRAIKRIGEFLSYLWTEASVRYQAYQYAKEGTPEYACIVPFCVDATAHLRKMQTIIERALKLTGDVR